MDFSPLFYHTLGCTCKQTLVSQENAAIANYIGLGARGKTSTDVPQKSGQPIPYPAFAILSSSNFVGLM
jgi:hypothetical protein